MKPCPYNCEVSFPYTDGQCRTCWNYQFSSRHKALWDATPGQRQGTWQCEFRGEYVGKEPCEGCKGVVEIKLFECKNPAVPEQFCTIHKKLPDRAVCAACSVRSIPAPGETG